jgi:membrane associated rhomboid family serine protease
MADLPTLLYYAGNMAFLCSFGLLLSARAVKKKFTNVFYFGIAILTNGGYYVINTLYSLLGISTLIFGLSELCVVLSFLPEIIFIKKTFYAGRNHPAIIATSIIYAVFGAISVLSGFLNDLDGGNPAFRVARYAIDDLVLFTMILTWNMVMGFRAYQRNARDANKAVRRRFLFFSYGQAFVIASSIIDFITAILASGSYDVYAPISLACAVLYAIFMYMTWFPRTRLASTVEASFPTIDGNQQKTVNMHVIEHFGKIIAALIGKTPSACSGLLLLSLESHLGEGGISRMTIKDLEDVIGGELRSRLQTLGIADPAKIVARLKEEIVSNISLFTMTMF